MNQAYIHRLYIKIRNINSGAPKIDGTTLKTYGMVISNFSMSDKDDRERFFEKSFLLPNVKSDIVFGMLFLTINNTDVNFQARDLQWRSYTTGNLLPTTR